MSDDANKALLPDGLRDELSPDAEYEATVIARLLNTFSSFGYQRVKPPLIEFESTLLEGPGGALARRMFRLMDPVSQRMLGLRVDITPQIARIATTRLGAAERPLRLSYAGQILRTHGSQLRPGRQFAQAGVELVGAPQLGAEAEVVQIAAEALSDLGVEDLSIDFCLPALVAEVCQAFGFDDEASNRLRSALDAKDAAQVATLSGSESEIFSGLLSAAGPAPKALEALGALELPRSAAAMCDDLAELVALLAAAVPGLAVTIDPGESRGFRYQSGNCFTFFAKGVRGELGRGGRYRLDGDEPAVGFTIYLDSLLRALPRPSSAQCVYMPFSAEAAAGEKLRNEGWRVIRGLTAEEDAKAEARRLDCSHVLVQGEIEELT